MPAASVDANCEALMPDVLLLNGPNLAMLGVREPGIYGTVTLEDVANEVAVEVEPAGWRVRPVQRNGEGELIDVLEAHWDAIGAIVNPGAYMIAGWALRDALAAYPAPWVEVHISNVWARECFRHTSVLSAVADGVVTGFGTLGYTIAAQALLRLTGPAAR
jgi:5-deoxy-5-amino-3-dehydroquinate dehydratase